MPICNLNFKLYSHLVQSVTEKAQVSRRLHRRIATNEGPWQGLLDCLCLLQFCILWWLKTNGISLNVHWIFVAGQLGRERTPNDIEWNKHHIFSWQRWCNRLLWANQTDRNASQWRFEPEARSSTGEHFCICEEQPIIGLCQLEMWRYTFYRGTITWRRLDKLCRSNILAPNYIKCPSLELHWLAFLSVGFARNSWRCDVCSN